MFAFVWLHTQDGHDRIAILVDIDVFVPQHLDVVRDSIHERLM